MKKHDNSHGTSVDLVAILDGFSHGFSPLPVAVTKSRSSSSSRGTKRAACGVLASAARSTGRLRSAGELCLADGLQDLLWNKDPIIEVILVIVN